jgi:transcriptional regulator with XRE-family HTH domain
MAKTPRRIHRPRAQTPEQEAEERALREQLQKERPSLQDLVESGDFAHVFTMGEYWELRKTFAALKPIREKQGLSISDMEERTGMDRAMISRLENGQVDNPTIATISRYAKALGQRVLVSLMASNQQGPARIPRPVSKVPGPGLPAGWRLVKLAEVAEINPRRPPGFQRAGDAPTSFVPMSAVDAIRGIIADRQVRPYAEVASGYTWFGEGDVLFAKITPCMQNGKHAIAKGLIDGIGFASTEFHVIRSGPDLDPRWIHAFLRQPSLLNEATNHFTGAVGQQRVPDEFLRKLRIPLPPLAEQQRIATVLQDQMATVERARAAAEAQLKAIEALPGALLARAFHGELGDGQ